MFQENLDKIFYSHWYYLAIIANVLAIYKVVIKNVIRNKILRGHELLLVISWGYLSFIPMINEAMAIVLIFCILMKILIIISDKTIFDFNKPEK
jgi:hypothetical protein